MSNIFVAKRTQRAAHNMMAARARNTEKGLATVQALAEFMVSEANKTLPADVGAFEVAREGRDLYLSFFWLSEEDVPAIKDITIDPCDDPCGYVDAVYACMPSTVHGADAPWVKWGGNAIIAALTSAGASIWQSGVCNGEEFVLFALP